MSQVLDGLIRVRLGKMRGEYISAYISGTVGPIYFKLGQDITEGVALFLCQ